MNSTDLYRTGWAVLDPMTDAPVWPTTIYATRKEATSKARELKAESGLRYRAISLGAAPKANTTELGD